MDYYKILGLTYKTASPETIKKKYRALSMKYHPDSSNLPDAQATYQNITEAYNVLSDKEKKHEYDLKAGHIDFFSSLFGASGDTFSQTTSKTQKPDIPTNIFDILNQLNKDQTSTAPPMRGGMPFSFGNIHVFAGQNPDEVFHDLFSEPDNLTKTSRRVEEIVNENIKVSLTITLEQAYQGGSFPLTIKRKVNDSKDESEKIYVNVFKGVDSDEMILIEKKGNIMGNHKSDVECFIKIKPHNTYERSGLDLIYTKQITLCEALCGFEFEVPFITGERKKFVKQKGSTIQPNFSKSIPKMGMKRDGHIGDLVLKFFIVFPEKLDVETIDSLKLLLENK